MPDTLQALVLILTFAVPAFIALNLYKVYHPIQYHQAAPTSLEQVSLYISVSVVINTLILIILVPILLVLYNTLPDLFSLVILPVDFTQNLQFFNVLIHTFLYFIASILVIFLIDRVIIPRLPGPELPLWWNELIRLAAKQQNLGITQTVMAQLESGDYCAGVIERLIWIGGEENAIDLYLKSVSYWRKDDPNPIPARGILLRSKNIIALKLYM